MTPRSQAPSAEKGSASGSRPVLAYYYSFVHKHCEGGRLTNLRIKNMLDVILQLHDPYKMRKLRRLTAGWCRLQVLGRCQFFKNEDDQPTESWDMCGRIYAEETSTRTGRRIRRSASA